MYVTYVYVTYVYVTYVYVTYVYITVCNDMYDMYLLWSMVVFHMCRNGLGKFPVCWLGTPVLI